MLRIAGSALHRVRDTGDYHLPDGQIILIFRSRVKPEISENQKYSASVFTQISGKIPPSHREMRGVGHRH
jgi:hypothetical protein